MTFQYGFAALKRAQRAHLGIADRPTSSRSEIKAQNVTNIYGIWAESKAPQLMKNQIHLKI